MKAAICGHVEVAQLLIQAGANASLKSNSNMTADQYADINAKNSGIGDMVRGAM